MRRLSLLSATTIGILVFTSGAIAGVRISTPAESLAARLERAPRVEPEISPDASPSRAMTLSLVSTAVPVAVGAALIGSDVERNLVAVSLIGSGIVVGPAIGYLDAGLVGRGVTGIGLRVGVVVLGYGAAASMWQHTGGGDIEELAGPAMVFLGGCVVATGLAIYDCAAVHQNVSHARRATTTLVPANVAGAPGVGVTVRF